MLPTIANKAHISECILHNAIVLHYITSAQKLANSLPAKQSPKPSEWTCATCRCILNAKIRLPYSFVQHQHHSHTNLRPLTSRVTHPTNTRVDTCQLHVREGPRVYVNPHAEWEQWEYELPKADLGQERAFSMPMYKPEVGTDGGRLNYVVMGAWGSRTISIDTLADISTDDVGAWLG